MEKNINLYIYELDNEGNITKFETTNVNTPRDNCLSVLIDLKESMQIEKLKINNNEVIPKVEHKEKLLDVKETEFGWELTSEVLVEPVKTKKELQIEEMERQLAALKADTEKQSEEPEE